MEGPDYMKQHPSPGDLVVLKENQKYSGIVINRKIMKDFYKDSLGLDLTIPLMFCGTLGIFPLVRLVVWGLEVET
jgi:hypothetical protein